MIPHNIHTALKYKIFIRLLVLFMEETDMIKHQHAAEDTRKRKLLLK